MLARMVDLLLDADATFYLREIVRRTGAGQAAVQRELPRFSEAGTIKRRDARPVAPAWDAD